MKTKVYHPIFFLVNKDQVIKVDRKLTLGRTEGDIVFESDHLLSSVHCELNPMLMEMYIKDLESTNGVYVNRQKIFAGSEVKLSPGDLITIGSLDYTLYDSEKKYKTDFPPFDRRKTSRPENLYSPQNLMTFFSAPALFKISYFLMIVLAGISFSLNLRLEIPLPPELSFLDRFYSDQIVFSGIKMIVLVWLVSFIHSFLLYVYFNRSPLRKGISLAVYFALLFSSIDFAHGPLSEIKSYAKNRRLIESIEFNGKAILHLKMITRLEKKYSASFRKIKDQLNFEQRDILQADYKSMIRKIDSEMIKLNNRNISSDQ
jgi:hypothetical protein